MQVVFFIAFFFLLVYTVLIIYYRQSWVSIFDFRFVISDFRPATKISVIIPARNEEGNIGVCLQSIINQSYPAALFEVIVVDDHSTDNTVTIVNAFNLPNIKLIALKDFVAAGAINSYKKKAIEMAILQSTGDLIVTTDADCVAPENWLQTIAAFYQEKKPAFIVMPVAIRLAANRNKPQGMFLQIFQSLDFMTLQGITGASVHKKMHSMCNGANLAYTKKAFSDVNGFAGIDTIASGDDMLLMHKIYKQDPAAVLFLKSKAAIVQTLPVLTIKEFFNQRIRWASKADKYDDKRIFAVLLIVYLFNLLLIVLLVIALFNNAVFSIRIYPVTFTSSTFEIWLFLLVTKTAVELFFLSPVAKFFNNRKLLWLFPLMEPFHIVYTVIAGWLGKFGNYNWKGRNVK
ncbi:glycosyltransferase [Ferruginibacter sp. SUN106]|uniref:glycosyltransferase n=1 Tax=Ferruginibacter sp. SUN106 TaxID=2978348 RepID=UPI003D3671D0